MSKLSLLDELYSMYRNDFEGEEFVPGDGNVNAKLLLIGEAPGKDEVKLGKPFVGMAGRNLTEFLELLGMSREEIFITNAIKYRLSKVNPESGRTVNRPAALQEIKKSREYLLREVDLIDPKYIITLGNVPLRAVTGEPDISIGNFHGALKEIELQNKKYYMYPLYHPASVIYNRKLQEVYIEDIKNLRNIISGTPDI